MDEGPRIALKMWKLQRRRKIKKARKQAGTQNTRSIGELPGRAVGEEEVGDVVEDAEYGGSAEDEEGVDPRPSQRGRKKLRMASGCAGTRDVLQFARRCRQSVRGEKRAEGRGKPTQVPRIMSGDEGQEGADLEGAPRRMQSAVADPG